MEGKRNGKIRAFQQALTLLKKPLDQPAEAWGCGVKGGADGIGGHLLQFTGDDRREQTHKTRLPWDFSSDRGMTHRHWIATTNWHTGGIPRQQLQGQDVVGKRLPGRVLEAG